jgi:hypothetical protein
VSCLLRARSHYVMPSYNDMNTDNSTIVTVLQFCKYHNIQAIYISPTLASAQLPYACGSQYRVTNVCKYKSENSVIPQHFKTESRRPKSGYMFQVNPNKIRCSYFRHKVLRKIAIKKSSSCSTSLELSNEKDQ